MIYRNDYIVSTNDDALCDTMNGMVTGKLIRCKDCVHKSEYGYCTLYLNFHHLTENMDYCSRAERKEE